MWKDINVWIQSFMCWKFEESTKLKNCVVSWNFKEKLKKSENWKSKNQNIQIGLISHEIQIFVEICENLANSETFDSESSSNWTFSNVTIRQKFFIISHYFYIFEVYGPEHALFWFWNMTVTIAKNEHCYCIWRIAVIKWHGRTQTRIILWLQKKNF